MPSRYLVERDTPPVCSACRFVVERGAQLGSRSSIGGSEERGKRIAGEDVTGTEDRSGINDAWYARATFARARGRSSEGDAPLHFLLDSA